MDEREHALARTVFIPASLRLVDEALRVCEGIARGRHQPDGRYVTTTDLDARLGKQSKIIGQSTYAEIRSTLSSGFGWLPCG